MEYENYEEEISLKELILVLIHNWKIVVGSTAVFSIAMLIYLLAFASSVYQSNLEGMVHLSGAETKYGTYNLPSSDEMDYLRVAQSDRVIKKTMEAFEVEGTLNGFRGRLEIEKNKEGSGFVYSLKGGDPEEVKAMVEYMRDLTLDELEKTYRRLAVDEFVDRYTLSTLRLEDQVLLEQARLVAMEEELSKLEPTITLKKLALSDPIYVANLAQQRGVRIENLSNEAMLEEVINPHHLSLQGEIINLRKSLQDIQVDLEKNARYLEELRAKKQVIRTYQQTGDDTAFNDMDMRIFTNQIRFNAQASFPENRIAPRRSLNMAIAIVLGGMIGVFAAFFKAYWKEEKYS